MTSKVTSIETAVPRHRISQDEALQFMIKANGLTEEEAHHLRVLYRAGGIQYRHSVISDFGGNDFELFKPESPISTTKDRANIYRKYALKLSAEAASKCIDNVNKNDITHLITVSCTGMYAPGLDIDLVNELGLKSSVNRTCINYMGCYGAFNAIKVADSICRSENAKVLIVCTEICTIHFRHGKDDDSLLANALFGDGSAAILMESSSDADKFLKIEDARCDLLKEGSEEMAWQIGDHGFEMKLSAYVPQVIETGIDKLLSQFKSNFDFYAIHPGGKKILQVLEKKLGITKNENRQAHEILSRFGNMSSATVLFVLKEIFDSLSGDDENKNILSMAFGPGITLESIVFKVHHA